MVYKLYSISDQKSFEFSDFQLFSVSLIDDNEFSIVDHAKKQSVRLCEVFVFCGRQYFIFDSEKLNFLSFDFVHKSQNPKILLKNKNRFVIERRIPKLILLFNQIPCQIYLMCILLVFCAVMLNQNNTLSREEINWNSPHIKQAVIHDFFQKMYEASK